MNINAKDSHRLSLAPMMEYTDPWFRWFLRQITRRTLLYTEMVVDTTLIHAQKEDRVRKYLNFFPQEHPVCVQLGGSDPQKLALASRICESFGYDEINLNAGCPSDRVQSGAFGACLMKQPNLVARCFETMQASVSIPVSVKHRIGVDELDSQENLEEFIRIVSNAGCKNFIIHARKAWLKGLSPAQNRTVPPLCHERVHETKKKFPHLKIEINGGIRSVEEVLSHLESVDGVMVGRAMYENPFAWIEADKKIFGENENPSSSRKEILLKLYEFIKESPPQNLSAIFRHIMGLYHGVAGARAWRTFLSEGVSKRKAAPEVLKESLDLIPENP